ncbi:MAG: 3-phosphoshikimate 1-carboxyvinyltransferase [Oscillatoriales cyanobacterium SM2_2_1]|nr:3-phosphoshikimate 1-carboxyvinyltransferase [Oscillatoriales cyanobacterium SM2_2_1]
MTALTLSPATQGLRGRITVPGDKSISHRALMLGAIATGTTTIRGLLLGEDPRSTAACFAALGATISPLNDSLVTVEGIGLGALQEPVDVLNAGNSGTTLRLMLGLLAAQPRRFFTITGDGSLRSRPMKRVIHPLQEMGAEIWCRAGGYAPLAVRGQMLRPITFASPVASAQVKSCLMLAALTIDGAVTITEPEQSRDHSERMMAAFGADVTTDHLSVTVRGGRSLHGQEITVPGDISSAAFWLVAASIIPDSDLVIENVGINPTRTGVLEILQSMGADITIVQERLITGEPVADLRVRTATLRGTDITGAIIPRLIDELPILAIAAAYARGFTRIRDAAELRVKECDRITAMVNALAAMGAEVTEQPDGMDIHGGGQLRGTDLESYGDHRIAMSLAIAALGVQQPITLHGAECIAISYPSFIATLHQLQ